MPAQQPEPDDRAERVGKDTAIATLATTSAASTGVSTLPMPKPATEAMDPATNPARAIGTSNSTVRNSVVFDREKPADRGANRRS